MAQKEHFKQSVKERQNRYFSEEFRKRKVKEIENKLTTIAEISREYELSRSSVQKWIYKYSQTMKRGEKKVIESDSDTRKLSILKERIKELERIVGQKQIELDFKDKMIELAEQEYKIDIKKKSSFKH